VQRRVSTAAPCRDFDLDGTPRPGRPPRLLFPCAVAPYAGSMTAVYAWYPGRYNAKDALRMGNYTMLGYVGGNIALEFLYSGPHSLLSSHAPEQWARRAQSGFKSVIDRKSSRGRRHEPTLPGPRTPLMPPTVSPRQGPGPDQRVFRMVRRSGHIFLASCAGCGDAAV
jgi:hypothetical protein